MATPDIRFFFDYVLLHMQYIHMHIQDIHIQDILTDIQDVHMHNRKPTDSKKKDV